MKIGDYEVSEPISQYNRGYLEGLAKRTKEIQIMKELVQELLDLDCRIHRCIHREAVVKKIRTALEKIR